jgi:hypothetical protein
MIIIIKKMLKLQSSGIFAGNIEHLNTTAAEQRNINLKKY